VEINSGGAARQSGDNMKKIGNYWSITEQNKKLHDSRKRLKKKIVLVTIIMALLVINYPSKVYAPEISNIPISMLNFFLPDGVWEYKNPRLNFIATGYDLSVRCCGKSISHPSYGLTASGFSLAGKRWQDAMTIAADPKLLPLGTKVQLTFKDPYHQKYNGIYIVRDTGGMVKGKAIDVFVGDFGQNEVSEEAVRFGRYPVSVLKVK